jgi:hypothetical protein
MVGRGLKCPFRARGCEVTLPGAALRLPRAMVHPPFRPVVRLNTCPFVANTYPLSSEGDECLLVRGQVTLAPPGASRAGSWAGRASVPTSRLPRSARRESGAATRAQRDSCHRTPNFPPHHAQHNLYAPAQREIMSKNSIPLFIRNACPSHTLVPNRGSRNRLQSGVVVAIRPCYSNWHQRLGIFVK